jgi:hypothetical protein
MEPIKCKCGKKLKSSMEVEYSQHLTEYFCSPECATDRYFEYMGSCCVDFSQPLPEGAVIVRGSLVRAAEHMAPADGASCPACGGSLAPNGQCWNPLHNLTPRR